MEDLVAAAPDTQPVVSTEAAEDTAAAAASPEDGLDVRFNKQTHTLSREDAIRYAQKGMKYDAVEPLLATLKDTAAREGKTLKEWVGTLSERPSVSPDEVLAQRLAEEYAELCREVPNVGEFSTLPEAAVRLAAEQGIPLLDAYLRYEYRERRRVEEERAAAAAAARASTGALHDSGTAYASPVEAAMLRGIWGA